MKILFGKYKGRNIIVGNNEKMRPTTGIAKSKIFNILDIDESTIAIDMFAGTGALGFETLSQGAGKVYFIDNNIFTIKALNETMKSLNIPSKQYEIIYKDFRSGLKQIKEKVNLVLLDPPFIASKYWDEALKTLLELDILSDDAIIVLEKPFKLQIESIEEWSIIDNRRVGDKDLIFLKKK